MKMKMKNIDETIYIIQYPEGELSVSFGILNEIPINKDNSEEKKEDKFQKRNQKKIEQLKKKNIDINNLYEINKEFNYSEDNPVFYLKENMRALDKYPWPMTTKQIVKLIQREEIPYENQYYLVFYFVLFQLNVFFVKLLIYLIYLNWFGPFANPFFYYLRLLNIYNLQFFLGY